MCLNIIIVFPTQKRSFSTRFTIKRWIRQVLRLPPQTRTYNEDVEVVHFPVTTNSDDPQMSGTIDLDFSKQGDEMV